MKKLSGLFLLLLAACGTAVSPAVPVMVSQITETVPLIGVATASPLLTDVPATITAAPPASPVPTAQPTEEDILYRGESPDGAWEWVVLSDPRPDGTLLTRFTSTVDQTTWEIVPSAKDPLGMDFQVRYYRPFFWLPGEPYVYLEGDGCCVEDLYFFPRSLALARLDLATGKIVSWPVAYNWVDYYTFSFSPSGAYLLSSVAHQHTVQITTLRDGTVQAIPLPEAFDQAGQVTWSPDEQAAAMMVCKDMNYDTVCSAVPLIVVRAGQDGFSTVVSDWVQALDLGSGVREEAGFEWTDDTHLLLHGPEYKLVYDMETGVLSKR